ncbi:MAG TPA: trypsin-like serine protease [Polyangiaceae bacterium]|nr:trypsin-like serine protease [Polyangiaceae bacterium]
MVTSPNDATAARRALFLTLALAAGSACSSDHRANTSPAAAAECPGQVQQGLVGATTDESFLGITPAQARAIVELIDGSGTSHARCSGTFVTPDWVLGAAHCLAISSPAARLQLVPGSAPSVLPFARTEVHPSLDLALFQIDAAAWVDANDVRDLGVTPIPASSVDPRLSVGAPVELAGYGLTQTDDDPERRFLVESIIEVDGTTLRVDGFGLTGACEGDSGGPLLARGADGSLVVAGALSNGSGSCRGTDRYVRTDAATAWLTSITGPYTAPAPACGSIDAEGRCLYGSALWCEDDVLTTRTCATHGDVCGWDPAANGFRCVPARTARCANTDALGTCRGGTVATCDAGELVVTPCGSCNACRLGGQTGAPYCANAADPAE